MTELTRAPILSDVTNRRKQEYIPLSKAEKLNDLSEPSLGEFEEAHGFKLDDDTYYCTAGRGNSFTSARIRRARKQPVRVVREIPHCSGVPFFRARGALSRPAPGRCCDCHDGIHKIASTMEPLKSKHLALFS